MVAAVRREVAELGDDARLDDVVARVAGVVGSRDRAHLVRAVRDELSGAGPLQPLLDTEGVTDVLVNGAHEVWLDRGRGLERAPVDLGDARAVRALAVRLAAVAGRRLDDASPTVDASLPDGTRLHAVLPPVADGGAVLSLRVLRRRRWTVPQLLASGGLTPTFAGTLEGLVRARANLLVSGGTGTGKTTLLGTLLGLVPPDQRVVCIEEAPELDPDHPHVVRLVARPANVEGAGEVSLSDLVRTALRMRPDRLVLGECRGAEVRDVLSALNTGHEGGCATIHANTVEDVPARLEALGALAGLDRGAVAAQAVSAVHAVVHLRRDGGLRYVSQVGEVVRGPAGFAVRPVLERRGSGAVATSPAWPAFARRWGVDGGLT